MVGTPSARLADVIIIGTGVIGTATAFELSKSGFRTLSIDRNSQIGHGSTAGSCAIIRMHYSTFEGTAFAWEGYHYWRDWQEYLGLSNHESLARFIECGCLVMKTEGNEFLKRHISHSQSLSIPIEHWDSKKITTRLPIYDLSSFAPPKLPDHPEFGLSNGRKLDGGVFWPKAGYVTDPALSAQNLANAAAEHGAIFRLGAEVVEIVQKSGAVRGVILDNGEKITAPVIINIAGPGSSYINRLARVTDDMTIQTRPLRQEVVHLPSPSSFNFERDGMIISDNDIALYCRPEHGNHILIGSEDPPCDEHKWVDNEKDYDDSFSDQWTTQAIRYAQRVPELGISSKLRGVVDLYDASTDWIPIYDKSSLEGYYMACGTSGNQYKNAPIAGKLMSALVNYCENGNDHDRNPLSFTLPYTGLEIDAGFYSRKRSVNTESSFSVLG